LRKVGVPYPDGYEQVALKDLNAQATKIADSLKTGSIKADSEKEIVALIAYLQRLGTDIKAPAPQATPPVQSTEAAPAAEKTTAQITTR
jgi:cytochrome c oxidase cbb3-type subunit I/II